MMRIMPGNRAWAVWTVLVAIVMAQRGLPQDSRPAGLVGCWTFDEVKGRLTPDASGEANDAMVTAGTLVKGVRNAAMRFDGESTYVRCASSAGLSPTDALTIEAWVMLDPPDFSGYRTVVRKEGSYALRFGDKRLGFLVWIGNDAVRLNSEKADWPAGQWLHLAGTYDGAQMRLFIDGQEDKSSPQRQTGPIDTGLADCCIGSGPGGEPFQGAIDEVRIYNRALSPDEIKASYGKGQESLRAQKEMAFNPQNVGEALLVFRKPGREIKMTHEGFIWVDAEDFTDYGGWLLDTQFVHLMGSAYLIAAGVGTPVKDATVSVEIPRAGKYRLWVRAKNWLKSHSPGQFQVLINGKPSTQPFGAAATEDWLWQTGGEFDIEKGPAQIALHDLTGYFGRCDALILTTDLAYTPPAQVEAILQERSRLTGLSLEPKLAGEFDVIVVGAGSAGSCAAVAAARMGAKTALIQNRPVLGGNSSKELGVPINGAASCHPNARESGIIEEAGRIKARFGYPKMSEAFAMLAEKEKNLTVLFNQHVCAVEMAGEKVIASVKAVDTLTGTYSIYRGKIFIDCTGDGWVGFYAKAKYRFGREARGEFNESLAPEKADQITMSGCIMGERALGYRAENMGKPVAYTPPPWAPKFPSPEQFGRHVRGVGGEWWLEHPGDIDDIYDAEKARDELIRISFGYWDYLKNIWPDRQKAANYAMTAIPIVDAKRESRRLVGDYILTQNDVQNAVSFPDRISYGGWPLDVHNPRGIYSGKEGPFYCDPGVPIYVIPYRCLYSANIDNLLFAGRDMSVTHIALGTVRVQGTLAALGQAAGTAAALALRHNTTPRGIYEAHIGELQQTLLRNDQYIPGIVNADPLDLARKAKLSASSTAQYEEFGRGRIQLARKNDDLHPLNTPRAVLFPRGMKNRVESIGLRLASELDQPVELALHVRAASAAGEFSSARDIAVAKAPVPPKTESWVEFKLDCETQAPYLWVWLPKTDGISWRLMETAPLGASRAYGGGPWTVVKGQHYAFFTQPALAIEGDYGVENITNGVTRIVDTSPNLWASDPAQPMPQWVELSFAAPTKIATVYLTFDTDMNAPFHTVPIVPQCVRDYELSYHDGAKWVLLVTEKGNFQRRRTHHFEPVLATKLRLTVQATNGHKSARVFEIRAYEE